MPDYRSDPHFKDFFLDIGAGFAAQPAQAGPNRLYAGTHAAIQLRIHTPERTKQEDAEVDAITALIGGFNAFTMQKFTDDALTPPPSYDVTLRDGFLKYGALAVHYARQYKLSPLMVLSQVQHESQWIPTNVSPAGARGLMQLMPGTVRDLNQRGIRVTNVNDPAQNLNGGCYWNVWGYDFTVKNNVINQADKVEYMLATFNGGIGTVQKAVRAARRARNMGATVPMPYNLITPYLPSETRNYVKGILRDTGKYVSFVNSLK